MLSNVSSGRAFQAVARYLTIAYGPDLSEDMELIAMWVLSDPGCWEEWQRCSPSTSLDWADEMTASEAFDTMRRFVQLHSEGSTQAACLRVLEDSKYHARDDTGAPITSRWLAWLQALEADSV